MDHLISIWQELPRHIDPVALSIGPLSIKYYSLMYLVAFGITYVLVNRRLAREPFAISPKVLEDLFLWCIIGLLAGARVGYVLFYDPQHYLRRPLDVILPVRFDGGFRFTGISGMSYHGGLLGIIVVAIVFCRRNNLSFWDLADLFCPAIPLGYTFGRLGNFFNGELFGRATTVSWGMYFPLDSVNRLRHPSQLYEAFFEGLFLFAVLWSVRKFRPFPGFSFGLYLICYGTVRFVIEFTREPDSQLGFVAAFLTMGQILCLVMIAAGAVILLRPARSS
ncbi:MAG: prolipoprotein diacylglyceryl transferase [Deltaproteobacteria bacterium]|nr:prolipoprotein diacylglyceryl transferase [Deltaproteobacteria bacterium]